jgi:hypothetical protein
LPNRQLDASMEALRRLLSIALLAVFSLSFVSPLFGLGAKSVTGVPACCRRDGKHHCTSNMGEKSNLPESTSEFSAPPGKCPFYPAPIAIVHGNVVAVSTAQAVYAGLIAHPAVVAQTESKLRISLGRSRQKRGPPVSYSL